MAATDLPGAEKRTQVEDTKLVQQTPSPSADASAKYPLRQRIKDVAGDVYQKTIGEYQRRTKGVSRSGNGRRVPLKIEHAEPLVDTHRGHAYISNTIRTSRYTVWDFIPKQLFFQFSRVGNFYFLCVGIPQTVRNNSFSVGRSSAAKVSNPDIYDTIDPRLVHDWFIHYDSSAYVLCSPHNSEGRIR